MTDPQLSWIEQDEACTARWHSESGTPPPRRVQMADDTMNADTAFRLACEGTALLWRGDFQNARLLLQAVARRAEPKPKKAARKKAKAADVTPAHAFHLYRQSQAQRARILGMLLIPVGEDYTIPLRRAPDISEACVEAYGESTGPFVVSLRELLGVVSAHEWRKKGVEIPELGARIHAHYGVYSPVRGEYVDLVAKAPLPGKALAFDIGTGTGVLAALLVRRGVVRVIATDQSPRAIACARDNIERLGMSGKVEIETTDLFPDGRASLVVCNPPWLPAAASSLLEQSVYDPDSRMLKGFLSGLAAHLTPGGEGWLILSDLAEHLGLRSREFLQEEIAKNGLKVVARTEIRPRHSRATDESDPLHHARSAEMTSLWRLAAA